MRGGAQFGRLGERTDLRSCPRGIPRGGRAQLAGAQPAHGGPHLALPQQRRADRPACPVREGADAAARPRTAALLYVPDGDNVAIIASKGGYPQHPAWYHNLRANPETSAQIGTERRPVRAREATPEERERIWERAVELWPQYAAYQARTERQIPIMVLERRES